MKSNIVGLRIIFDGTDNFLAIHLIEAEAKEIITKWSGKQFPPLHVLSGSCLKTGISWAMRTDRIVCMHTYIEVQPLLPPQGATYGSGGKN